MHMNMQSSEKIFAQDMQELIDLVRRPGMDRGKMESFLRVRNLVSEFHKEAGNRLFVGLFEKQDRYERDARTFIGRLREPLAEGLVALSETPEGTGVLEQINRVPGFRVVEHLKNPRKEQASIE